jgi:hypothetical protein
MATPEQLNNRKIWIEALRSGKYEQGRVFLEKDNKFCCLGVLSKISNCERRKSKTYEGTYDYDGHSGSASGKAKEFVGLRTQIGEFDKIESTNFNSLAELNDVERWSFDRIADFIESNPKGLFDD